MRILINGVGGPTPRSIARSLHRYSNLNVELFGTDINPYAYGLYESDLYKKTFLIPPASSDDYWPTITKIIRDNNIEFALVQPELEVLEWSKRINEGLELPCKVLLPDFEVTQMLIDKSIMTDVLVETGLVPNSLSIDPLHVDFESIESKLGYPFWIRSTSGSSGLGSLKVESKESLINWLTINPGVKQFIGSTYLPGRNLACKMLYYNGELIRSACGERVNYIMSKVAPSGITGNTSFGRLLNEPELVEETRKALKVVFEKTNTKPHGFFTADYKEDENGKPFITEINVRMVAFNMLFAQGGANFSEDIIRLLSEDKSFDFEYKNYLFKEGTIFLRDVDAEPIMMNEKDILR